MVSISATKNRYSVGQEDFLAVQVTKRRISGHGEAKCKSYVAAFPKDKLEFMSFSFRRALLRNRKDIFTFIFFYEHIFLTKFSLRVKQFIKRAHFEITLNKKNYTRNSYQWVS